jgi:hypothetical protein
MTRDRILELTHPSAERAPDLRQPLSAEEEKRDAEEDDDVNGIADVTHVLRE